MSLPKKKDRISDVLKYVKNFQKITTLYKDAINSLRDEKGGGFP